MKVDKFALILRRSLLDFFVPKRWKSCNCIVFRPPEQHFKRWHLAVSEVRAEEERFEVRERERCIGGNGDMWSHSFLDSSWGWTQKLTHARQKLCYSENQPQSWSHLDAQGVQTHLVGDWLWGHGGGNQLGNGRAGCSVLIGTWDHVITTWQ